ncbi:MAG: ABC transporter substrate-binding protein [Myxococcota bacterium]
MSSVSRRIGKWTAGLALIALIVAGALLYQAHRAISLERVPLPSPSHLADRLEAEEAHGPIRLYWINTASQTLPTSGVMDTAGTAEGDLEFEMSFPAFVLEWADGRLLLVDAGMDEAGARSFGAPLSAMGLAEAMRPHTSVADALGDARKRVKGIVFTHLHADHVGGLSALCQTGEVDARVFMTDAQSKRPNFTTSGGLEQVLEANCVETETPVAEALAPVPGFPGVGIIAAAGHTPGSQLIVARIGSGPSARNVVFTGDIVNHAQAIPLDRGKPFLYRTFLVPEDESRQSSLRGFLRDLHDRQGFGLLVSHDQRALEDAGVTAWSQSLPPITLGAIYDLSGSQSALDRPSARGAQLAVEQANRSRGLLGRELELVLTDGESQTQVVSARTQQLLSDHPGVTALLGLSDTGMVLAAAPAAAADSRVFMTSGATSPRLPAQVPEYLFLACFGDNVQAAAAAEWAFARRSARTASILYNQDMEYTRLLQGYFARRWAELGGTSRAVPFTPGHLDQAIADLPEADIIYFAGGPGDAAEGVSALRKAGLTVPIVGGDGLDIGEDWRHVSGASQIYFTTHAYLGIDNTAPIVVGFREDYEAAYPGESPTAFSALGYDAANLLMAAIAEAGRADPAAVLDALPRLQNFVGVTGSIQYENGSRIPTKPVTLVEVQAGELRLVEEFIPESVPSP